MRAARRPRAVDVGFAPHNGLWSDIALSPKSANRRPRSLRPKKKSRQPRRSCQV